MNQPFFSIIIPTLNEEKYLPLLLTDLVKQSNDDFEVIVVDGKSEDATVAKVKKFQEQLRITIVTSDKRNVSYQRNLGAKKAKGTWLLFMDADNRVPHYFLDGIRYRIAKSGVDVFTTYCDSESNNAADKLIAQGSNALFEIGLFLDKPAAFGAMIGTKSAAFEKIGGFDVKHIPFEDKKFIREAVEQDFRFTIFKDPKYYFSTRRYGKLGKLKTLQRYLELNIKDAAKVAIDQKEYPMGGHVFEKKHKA